MATSAAALTQIKIAMASTNELFSTEVVGKRNFEALDQIYAADARILPPGAPLVSGRPAIKQFWSNLIQAANAKSVALTSVDVMPSGDGVVEIGRAKLTMEPAWRQEDGRWKWHVDIWNQSS
jgi:ketosteroid isomerase-like protein